MKFAAEISKRRFNLRTCSLNYDRKDRLHPGCHGKIVMVGTIGLCPRHLALLRAIVRDANLSGARHPVHPKRAVA